MQTKWKYFLKNIKDDSLDFAVVIKEIALFLEPVYEAIIGERELHKMWICAKAMWE
jgi:2-hydroxy-3-keto-5-methylthiopentenyl-1-phosphate phosphatase